MSLLFWALTFFLLDHGALNLGDGKVAENPENIASITSKEDLDCDVICVFSPVAKKQLNSVRYICCGGAA